MTTIRNATPADFPAILALNAESVRFLSPMDAARLEKLHAAAAWHRVAEKEGQVAAFLLVFREGAAYDSPNYQWFSNRYHTFWYIDRVVVSERHQGVGLGPALYQDLFDMAAPAAPRMVTCEFDVEPPNPVSEKFHQRLGFREVGRHRVAGGTKLVSLQAADLPTATD